MIKKIDPLPLSIRAQPGDIGRIVKNGPNTVWWVASQEEADELNFLFTSVRMSDQVNPGEGIPLFRIIQAINKKGSI